MQFEWNENKRLANLDSKGLDFRQAWQIYESRTKITLQSPYEDEERLIDMAEINGRVAVLVYTYRNGHVRCISFRYAKTKERRMYYHARQAHPPLQH